MRKSIEQRFWEKVDIKSSSECWNWKAGISNYYGRFSFNSKPIKSNRMAYILSTGQDPKDKVIRHTCDNKLCCNPCHLISGTQQDNVNDAYDRKIGRHKLTKMEIRGIRIMRKGGLTLQEIADVFNVTRVNIHKIVTRKTWKHIGV